MAVGDGTRDAIDLYYSAITGIWGIGTLPSILKEFYLTVVHNITLGPYFLLTQPLLSEYDIQVGVIVKGKTYIKCLSNSFNVSWH